MNYPINLSFKLLALAPQISVLDATGTMLFYVKQKAFKLKEAITVFADKAQSEALYTINADKILDFSANYHFADMAGNDLGAVRRKGMKSIWKATYEILDGDEHVMTIQEANPWIKVLDALFQQIPLLNLFAGLVFNPSYNVTRADGTRVMMLKKQPAFFEGKFSITKDVEMEEAEELRALLGLLMMILLERGRG